jgi:hypothetical protein
MSLRFFYTMRNNGCEPWSTAAKQLSDLAKARPIIGQWSVRGCEVFALPPLCLHAVRQRRALAYSVRWHRHEREPHRAKICQREDILVCGSTR